MKIVEEHTAVRSLIEQVIARCAANALLILNPLRYLSPCTMPAAMLLPPCIRLALA